MDLVAFILLSLASNAEPALYIVAWLTINDIKKKKREINSNKV